MSNLPISSKYVSRPDAPVDAAEREAMVARVNAAYEAGALDEFDYRRLLDVAFAAKTLGELRPVAEAVPAQPTYATPGNIVAASVAPGEVSPARPAGGRLFAVGVLAAVAAVIAVFVAVVVLL